MDTKGYLRLCRSACIGRDAPGTTVPVHHAVADKPPFGSVVLLLSHVAAAAFRCRIQTRTEIGLFSGAAVFTESIRGSRDNTPYRDTST